MSKWYVEYKVRRTSYAVTEYIGNIEAKDGKEAIEYVKQHVIGAYKFKAYHDDEDE